MDEFKPHKYVPDAQAMGDCRICGAADECACLRANVAALEQRVRELEARSEEQSVQFVLAARVADTAVRFCEDLCEDSPDVPAGPLRDLQQALDDWEGVPRHLGMFDSREPARAALSDMAADCSLTDGQRRAAIAAFHGLESAATLATRTLAAEREAAALREERDVLQQSANLLERSLVEAEAERDALRLRVAECEGALTAILAEPHGCRFCDSGKLRNPAKDHDADCGFAMARAAIIAKEKRDA